MGQSLDKVIPNMRLPLLVLAIVYATVSPGDSVRELVLNVSLYLDKAWVQYHGQNSTKAALKVVEEANKIFQHPSLNTKLHLVAPITRIIKSRKRLRTLSRNMKKIAMLLKPPHAVAGQDDQVYNVCHIYLTIGGIVDVRSVAGSICGHAKHHEDVRRDEASRSTPQRYRCRRGVASCEDGYVRQPITAVKWAGTAKTTGGYLAMGLGIVLGMEHCHTKYGEPSRVCSAGEEDAAGFVMSYGASKEKWSNCSNEDFRNFYEENVNLNSTFCLEEVV